MFLALVLAVLAVLVTTSARATSAQAAAMGGDAASPPRLGRGYAAAAQRYLSQCIDVPAGAANPGEMETRFIRADADEYVDLSVETQWQIGLERGFVRATLAEINRRAATRDRSTSHVIVKLEMLKRQESIDATSASLSAAAAALLNRGAVVEFFSVCGSQFVYGIRRIGKLVAIFSYESLPPPHDAAVDPRDEQFETDLMAIIQDIRLPKPEAQPQDEPEDDQAAERLRQAQQRASLARERFHLQMVDRGLTITVRGWGLGKADDTSLVAATLPQFQRVVLSAYNSMAQAGAGLIRSVDLAPWTQNAAFKAALGEAGELDDASQERLLRNGEFLADIQRRANDRRGTYYQVKVCEQALRNNFSRAGGGGEAPGKVRLLNHRTQKAGVRVAELAEALGGRTLANRLYDAYRSYMYSSDARNVSDCIAALRANPRGAPKRPISDTDTTDTDTTADDGADQPGVQFGGGLLRQRHEEVSACQGLDTVTAPAVPSVVEDHCLPEAWQAR